MPPSQLVIRTVQDVTIVEFAETRIRETDQILQIGEELYALVDQQRLAKMVLDFSRVNVLSSAALGVLMTLRKKADAVKSRVVICGLKKELRDVFKISRLDRMFDFYDGATAAIKSFGVTE